MPQAIESIEEHGGKVVTFAAVVAIASAAINARSRPRSVRPGDRNGPTCPLDGDIVNWPKPWKGGAHMADLKGPLKGIRVIDLGRHQAGPRCAQVLARVGAEVIKIERLGGEETRYHAPWVGKQSAYWVQYNSGKKSMSMDLRKEEAKVALRKLVKVSDVLVQNFRPGTIEEMGFGYDVLKALNPRIIMVNVSAYGQFGPYREQIGYDPIGQTMSGIAMVTGEEGMPPIRAGVPIIDRTTALHSAIGTLAALFERGISGEGQLRQHVPLQGRLGVNFRWRPVSLAAGVQGPRETRVARRPSLYHPPRA